MLFQKALGMSWVRFLQGYGIHGAAALLNESGSNVTEAALEVGFDSFAHFNKPFPAFMGATPKDFHYGRGANGAHLEAPPNAENPVRKRKSFLRV